MEFTVGKSCLDNTLYLQQIITKQKAKNNETHLVFVNLVKAYDMVLRKHLRASD